jgi:hypothetical protein
VQDKILHKPMLAGERVYAPQYTHSAHSPALSPLAGREREREPNQQKSRLIVPLNQHALLLPLLHKLVEERAGLPAVGPAQAGERRIPTSSWAGVPILVELLTRRILSRTRRCPFFPF